MKKAAKKVRFWGRILFVVYLALLIYFLFFSEYFNRNVINDTYRYNLTLFSEISRFWNMRYTYGWSITLINIFGNVVCFLPFGFLLPTISKKRFKNFLSVAIAAAVLSALVEVAQMFSGAGVFDVDDILLNTIGGFLGYIWMKLTRVGKQI